MATTTSNPPPTSVLPPVMSAEGAPAVPLGEREQGRLEILGGPDWLAEGFGAIWVKTDRGDVLRVDPMSNAIVAGIPVSVELCQGLGLSPDAVWSCSREPDEPIGLARIDPAGNLVATVLEVGKSPDQGRLVFAQNHLWVLNGSGDQALGIDPETNQVGPIVDLGTRCTDLAATDNDFIWAACPIDGAVVRINPSGDPVRANVLLPGARQVAVDGWGFVGYDSGIAQLHPETMEVMARYDVAPGLGGAIWAGGDQLWVRRQEGPFLTRIDPVAVRIDEVIEAEGVTSGGDVLVAFDSVWATAYDDNLLVRLTP